MIERDDFIRAARSFVGTRFAHQGRTRDGMDCGGLILVTANRLNVSDLEFLGYASFPSNGKFEQLLLENTDYLGIESRYPHRFDGSEFLPGDLLSYDYNNGEGTRHIALITKFDGLRYWVVDAIPEYGVTEHPFAAPFSKATVKGWRVRGLGTSAGGV